MQQKISFFDLRNGIVTLIMTILGTSSRPSIGMYAPYVLAAPPVCIQRAFLSFVRSFIYSFFRPSAPIPSTPHEALKFPPFAFRQTQRPVLGRHPQRPRICAVVVCGTTRLNLLVSSSGPTFKCRLPRNPVSMSGKHPNHNLAHMVGTPLLVLWYAHSGPNRLLSSGVLSSCDASTTELSYLDFTSR